MSQSPLINGAVHSKYELTLTSGAECRVSINKMFYPIFLNFSKYVKDNVYSDWKVKKKYEYAIFI